MSVIHWELKCVCWNTRNQILFLLQRFQDRDEVFWLVCHHLSKWRRTSSNESKRSRSQTHIQLPLRWPFFPNRYSKKKSLLHGSSCEYSSHLCGNASYTYSIIEVNFRIFVYKIARSRTIVVQIIITFITTHNFHIYLHLD